MNKEGWKYKKLGEICEIKSGYTPPSANISDDGDIPYFKVGDMNAKCNNRYLRLTNNYVDSTNKTFPKGAIVFPKNGAAIATNKKRILAQESVVDLNTAVLIPCEYFNIEFLYYWICNIDFRKITRRGAVPTLDIKELKLLSIPLPPLSDQEAIVAELDLLSSVIEKQKKQLEELDTLAQSIFYDMFGDPVENEKGWEVKKLGEIALVKTGPFGSMLHKEDYITNGIPLINPMHMQDFKVVPNNEFTISKEKALELNNYILQENDMIFARRGDIGRCAVVTKNEEGYLCGTGSLFVRFTFEASPLYTMYVVRSDSFTKELISKAKGATMLNLNSTTMENLQFPLPPLPLQQSFAEKIQAIEGQKASVKAAMADTQRLFDYTMDKYFG